LFVELADFVFGFLLLRDVMGDFGKTMELPSSSRKAEILPATKSASRLAQPPAFIERRALAFGSVDQLPGRPRARSSGVKKVERCFPTISSVPYPPCAAHRIPGGDVAFASSM